MGVGRRGRLYTYRYTATARMTPTLRCAAMRAILTFTHYNRLSHFPVVVLCVIVLCCNLLGG